MYATLLLVHKISVSLFILFYLVRLIGLLGNIPAIQNLYAKKFMRIMVDMVISTLFLLTGVWMLLKMPATLISTLLILKIALVFISIPIAVIGFKRKKKALAFASMIILFGVYAIGEINRKRPVVNAEMVRTSVEGRELFIAANCNTCHGEMGNKPKLEIGAKDLSKSKLSDVDAMKMISNGKNNMPGYKKRLNEDQLKVLAEYIKSLRTTEQN